MTANRQTILPHLDAKRILDIYGRAPGSEVASGKFDNPESSAALAANAFGFFIDDPVPLPALPHFETGDWRPESVTLEAVLRFPWSGGRHPCLDALVRTPDLLIGIESKRYEPYRSKSERDHSEAYQRDVWGDRMKAYCALWSAIAAGESQYHFVDVAQLIKHAFAIRTQVKRPEESARQGVLYYLYADPDFWPDGSEVNKAAKVAHLDEIERFKDEVAGDEVRFVACSYSELLSAWEKAPLAALRDHARAVREWAQLEPQP